MPDLAPPPRPVQEPPRSVGAERTGAGRMTEAEYLRRERSAPGGPRHEFVDGRRIEMPGSSYRHNRIARRVARALEDAIGERAFEVVAADQRLRVPSGRHRYPDVMVVPDPPELLDEEQDTVLNPLVVVEILSPTTAATDTGAKLREYRALPSLTDYLILAQDGPRAELHSRGPGGGWAEGTFAGADAAVPLAGLGAALILGPLYPAG